MAQAPRIIVKTYGRASLLDLLGPLVAFLMASRGLNGWQQAAMRNMERDAIEMSRLGYRIQSSNEYGIPLLGITYYRVTYELDDRLQ